MAAPSPVLFALHNSIEAQGFENLCVDLLAREGHSRIIPGGKSRDHGRDAEVRFWTGSQRGKPQVAFQFSMESRWEAKLRKDITKITRHSDSINRIVFVSSRSITVEKQDKLREEFRKSHQVSLEILDEGWFRIRLEEEHIDLASKHLGVEVQPTPGFHATQIKIHGLTDENQEKMLRHTTPDAIRATLIAQTKETPADASAWKGLAHICIHQNEFEKALFYSSKALKNCTDEVERWNLVALKASIIAEQGIASGSRLLLRQAKDLFTPFIDKLGRSVDHYNLANIYGALKQREDAERHYRLCLDLEPNYPQAWKNLGSLLIKLRRREEGIECIDRALELRPKMLEALCTKANVLVMYAEDCSEALELLEQAIDLDPDLELRWPYAPYWHAMALCRQDRLPEALEIVEDRLERKFDCPYLGRLSNDILAKLWRSDPNYIPKAEKFFALRIDPKERNYQPLLEMLDLLDATNREDQAWDLLDDFLGVKELSVRTIAERVPLSIADLTSSFASVDFYRQYRAAAPLADYARIIADCGLRPHDDVPEILFHLLMPAYFKVASVFQDTEVVRNSEREREILIETYTMISGIFAALGGSLVTEKVPETVEKQSELLASAMIIGLDVPLMEISRLLGFLAGVSDRKIPDQHGESIVGITSNIHESWITAFLEAVGTDWKIGPWNSQK